MKIKEPELPENFHIPRWEELPNVDLYLDQVVTLINSCLNELISGNISEKKENPILTKTMINNYVKNNLIEAPIKKKYSKTQFAKIFAICVLKQVYSMNDIFLLITEALKRVSIEIAYNKFCDLFEQALICTYNKKDFIDSNINDEARYLLKSVLLSCSYKIYVENLVNLVNTKNST